MAILQIKVLDASGADLPGQTVEINGMDALQTNAQGMAQFLIGETASLDIAIGASACWSGATSALARQEVFQKTANGFSRIAG